MCKNHKVIIIVGTNASGKSGLAIRLAKKYNGEVISADSRQVYKGLDIATGKVTKKEMDGIPHHLIDVVSPKKVYTAADFARDGQKALQDILKRGKLPIIVGGTGFYIEALLQPEKLSYIPPNKKLRTELEKKSVEELFEQLTQVDAIRAGDLKTKNEQGHKRRIVRSLEIALTDPKMFVSLPNTLPTDKGTSDVPLYKILWIGIKWRKEELEKRIHERTLARLDDGMIEEALSLHEKGLSWKRMESLGLEYKHLANFLRKKITKEELIQHIETSDRQYAKQQRTWFKRNKEINWFDGGKLGCVEDLVEGFLK